MKLPRTVAVVPAFLLASLAFGTRSTAQVGIEWMPVGDPGNPNHPTLPATAQEGSIPYSFDVAKFEVTNEQYVAFLNAVAADDPNGLWESRMQTHTLGGILRTGTAGSFLYTVKPGFADKPVVYTSFWDAVRFANWLHNGSPSGAQGASTTEDGAYTLDPASVAANTVVRNAFARYAVPTRPEFWKLGYYDAGTQSWYVSPARSATMMSGGAPAQDDGNMGCIARGIEVVEDVGSYALSIGPHGTYDVGGNAHEWIDRITHDRREVGGGAWGTSTAASNINNGTTQQRVPGFQDSQSGFRLVRLTRSAGATPRNAGANPASLSSSYPILSSSWTVTVDLTTTGHGAAFVIGSATPTTLALSGGQVVLGTGARYFQLPAQPGPTATWTAPLPASPALAGFTFVIQAVHFQGVTPFALSNAVDCRLGF